VQAYNEAFRVYVGQVRKLIGQSKHEQFRIIWFNAMSKGHIVSEAICPLLASA
jgi:hypothetical protein